MPFDALKRSAAAAVGRGRGQGDDVGPRRFRIEIVNHRALPRRRPSIGLGFWLLLFLPFALAAHAQPTHWEGYQIGPTTYYSGTDASGGQWTAKSYEQWGTTFSEFDGPRGQKQHCRSWQQSGQTNTECGP
jgi:hypothetical protein